MASTRNDSVTTLYISSKDKVNKSDFTVRFPEKIDNVTSVEVKEVTLPLIIYNILPTCNSLTFTDSTASQYTVLVEEGSYDANTFASALALLMTTASGVDTFTISYSLVKFKFVIESDGASFSIDATPSNSVYPKMGIDSTVLPIASAALPTNQTVLSDAVIFGLPLHAYVESHNLSKSHNLHPIFMSSDALENDKNIVAKVPLSENGGGVIFKSYFSDDVASSIISFSGTNAVSQNVDIRLRLPNDEEFKIMSDWSLTVHVHYISTI